MDPFLLDIMIGIEVLVLVFSSNDKINYYMFLNDFVKY